MDMSEVNSAGYAATVKTLNSEMHLPTSMNPQKNFLN